MGRTVVALLGLLLLALGAYGASPPHLVLDVSLDPQSRQLKAEAMLQVAAPTFRFLLHESLRVTRAHVAGQKVVVEQSAGPKSFRQWTIGIGKPDQKLVISYAGELPPLERSRDHRSVLGGMPPMAAPEGSFLSAGSGWYPRPAEMFSYQVKVAVPHGQRAVVAGKRVEETLPTTTQDTYRASFEFTQPSDGIDLMAGPWVVREKIVPRVAQPPLHLRTFFPADLDATPGLAQAYLDDSQAYIERYSRQIGAYPYSEFSIVASPLPTGFGMPTLTYLGADVLRLPFIRKTSLGHEILHNWWGNGVYVDYERGNWCEGLTTFMADYAFKEAESASAASAMRLAWLRDAALFDADSSGEKPGALRDFRSRANAAGANIGYGKAAMVFVMLHDRLGAKVFDQGIRTFWASQRFKTASWGDLQAAFERASGEKLGGFFSPWLDQQALPAIAIAHADTAPSRTPGSKQHRLNIQFSKQDANLPLRLPVEVTSGGQRETHWVQLDAARNSATLELANQPQTLRLDPEMRVWRRLELSQLPPILRQWMAASAPQLVNVASPAARAAVDQLAERFFEVSPKRVDPRQLKAALSARAVVVLAGTHAEVDQALATAGLPARPPGVAGQGSAQVWTVVGQTFQLAVISGQDATALGALERGLPHYGGQSWLIFEQGRAVSQGIWAAGVPETPVKTAATTPKK
jgi:hypothetical protein